MPTATIWRSTLETHAISSAGGAVSDQDSASAITAGLYASRLAFLSKLTARMQEIDMRCDQLAAPEQGLAVARALCSTLHRMVGTAGTMGFAQLSAAATVLYDLVDAIARDEQGPDAASLSAVAAALAQLRRSGECALQTQSNQPETLPVLPEMPPVLLVEDDLLASSAMRFVLEAAGHRVEAFVDVGSFLERLQHAPQPLLTLMDQAFPEGDRIGIDATRAARERCPNVPVIMLSDDDRLEMRVLGLQAGAAIFLMKPVHPQQLLDVIAGLVAPRT